jgi:hypothetical protein
MKRNSQVQRTAVTRGTQRATWPQRGLFVCLTAQMRRLVHKGKVDAAVAARFAEVWPVGRPGGKERWGNFSGRLSVADLA